MDSSKIGSSQKDPHSWFDAVTQPTFPQYRSKAFAAQFKDSHSWLFPADVLNDLAIWSLMPFAQRVAIHSMAPQISACAVIIF
jgi:hypothetical protein